MIDGIDREILTIIQGDARISNAEVARRVGLAPSATLERTRKLEAQGYITGYEARLNAAKLGARLLAFIYVRSNEGPGSPDTSRFLSTLPEVQEIHHIAGEDCFLVKVRVADTQALARLLRERLGSHESIQSTRTTIVLETVKEHGWLPLETLWEHEDE
ncbi:MAG: Lrp/AsnC family transcriptional regulator [Anaerolineales bacterium]|nr:Lrp/AsnC family transcriptional regulator [Anaerolineales bacterium]MCB9128225.1 Lrp/AsnC family transcriptional regulator [Ardenticatenales bacterium]